MDIDYHEFGLVLCVVFEVVSDHGGVLGRHTERSPFHHYRLLHDLVNILKLEVQLLCLAGGLRCLSKLIGLLLQ